MKSYNPNQPRHPAGSPEGGQWTSDGSVAGNAARDAAFPLPTKQQEFEKYIKDLDYEMCGVFDQDGNLDFSVTQYDANQVKFAATQIFNMEGKVMVHNHPGETSMPPSGADLFMMPLGGLKETRVVSGDWTYSIVANNPWDPGNADYYAFREIYKGIGCGNVFRTKPVWSDMTDQQFKAYLQDELLRDVSERLNLTYTKINEKMLKKLEERRNR